jgi:hypothetical protein
VHDAADLLRQMELEGKDTGENFIDVVDGKISTIY